MSYQAAVGESTISGPATSKNAKSSIKVTKMINGPAIKAKRTPSNFLFEMKQSTEEKLANTREMYPPKIVELLDIGTSSHQKDVSLDVDQALFQPYPSEVFFQQFEPRKTYVFPLQLRNLDRVARHIKVTYDESPYFTVTCQKLAGSKVAPGMEITYQITFTPDENKDYIQELVFVTEREKFIVPVQAIGARALLDFPDDVKFSAAPVKYASTNTVLVRNVGNREGKFNLKTELPFSVTPTTSTLAVGACMQVSVEFTPKKLGDHNKELIIYYETGEEVYTQLYGSAVDVNVRLDRSSLTLDNTYLGLSSERSVVLHNRSNVVVHYQWKAFASELEENVRRQDKARQLAEEEALSKETFFDRCMHDPFIRDRLPILTRNLDIKKKYLDEEKFLYSDEAITLDPIEGDIWPNSQAEVSVMFQPEEATSYSRVLYCDITGRESRLPLKIRGEGVGPRCVFSFDTLDIQNVFVNSAHAYEVVIENKGDIEALFSLVPSESLFGPKFTFAPSNGVLSPGKLQAVQISFSSSELGGFNEEFQWFIEGSPQPLRLKIQGEVIGPTFQFDTSQINFGTVPYGFQTTKEVVLTNTSEIPMTFTLHVPGSGDPGDPQEFEISPESGTLPPNFHQVIQLHFTPSSVKAYSAMLVVDIQEAGRNVFSLPINAKATVPPIQLLTPLLNYGRCFLKHCYSHDIELLNDSEFPVKYSMCPQVDKNSLIYSSAQSNGVIAPHTAHSIELLIETQCQGEIITTALIDILGGTDPQLEVAICCIGEGPVINVRPDSLEWGICPVLSDITKTIMLSNESIIPAEFECTLAREKTIFSVEPISAVIPPNQSLELSVTALVDDSLKFSDKLTILVSDGVSFTVPLSAEGQGTTIVSHPPLQPGVDLGHYFSNGPCQNNFILTNRGRRVQALSWSTEGFSAAKLKKAELEKRGRDKKDMVVKHSFSKFLEVKKPLFEMTPNKWILEPYQSVVVTLIGHSDIPQVVNERLICHAIIGMNPLKERIMTVDVRAAFVAPLLEFSSQELLFKLHQPPGSKLIHHSQNLGVRNISPLPVTSLLLCEYPFSIIRDGLPRAQVELALKPQQDSTITVLYDSTYCADKHSRQEDSYLAVAYKEHSQKDRIALKSEVHFPNLSFEIMELDFGCILNDTESIQHITMTNNSPLDVAYSWSFLKKPPAQHVDPSQLDEGVDMQSECETDSLDEQSDQEDDTSLDATSETTEQDNDNSPSNHSSTVSPSLRSCNSHKRSQQSSPGSKTDGIPTSHSIESLSAVKDGVRGSPELQNLSTMSSAHSRDMSPPLDADTADEAELDGGSKSAIIEIKPQPWELLADPFTPTRIEQIFDILPLHGVLEPGTSQQVQFSFYGHSGVATEVTAACRVEGGPTYQLRLSGEASEVQYRFSRKWIDLGKAMYDHVHTSQILLYNSGKVDLDYCVLGAIDSTLHAPTPGSLSVHPPMGHIPALGEQIITITFLPGTPSVFEKSLHIQVAHFEPDIITVTGEAVFPRIAFDIQRDLSQVAEAVIEEAKTNLSSIEGESGVQELEAEVERLLVRGYAQDQTTKAQKKSFRGLPRFHLDFGYVVYGMVASRTFHLTNVGHIPVSFTTPHKLLQHSGFSVDLGEKVKALPPYESLDFTVTFDPAAIKCSNGKRLIEVPFNLVGGPSYSVMFTAQVTRPSMQFSESYIDFGTVVCGQCRLVTIRLTNPVTVSCMWTAVTAKPPKKIPRHVPLHLRKKMKQKPPPNFFEVSPSSGVLLPGKTTDIKIIFMPSEEIHYVDEIPFSVHQNPDSDLCLHVEGRGSEPQLVFSPTLVKYEPVLPFSPGSETEITVSNPMPYPVEFYSLEFDKQYLEEEEILRDIKEYDSQQRLMLPPPTLGESLPNEILKAYKGQKPDPHDQRTDTETNLPSDANLESTVSVQGQSQTTHDLLDDPKSVQQSTCALASTMNLPVIESLSALTQLTAVTATSLPEMLSPVKQAIAHYLGIDLSPEAAEAEKRKGAAIIVHGPPSSGRTTQAKRIAEAYGATVLVMDEVIIEAISSARTEFGRKARKYLIDSVAIKEDVNDAPSGLSVFSKKQFNAKEKEKDKETTIEVLPLPVPPSHFNVDVLQNSDFAVPEGQLMPIALPENLAYEILAERLQQSDCYRGVVFDGIESHFAASIQLSTCIVLRAFSNRAHIYFVNLEMDFVDIQKRLDNIEEIQQLQEENLQKELLQIEKIEKERIEKLLALDEDEYEAKSLEEQREIDTIRFRIKKEQREKRKQEKEEQKRREMELREEEMRRLEEEKMKKKGRKDPNKQHRASNVAKPPAVTVLMHQSGTSPGQSRPGSSHHPTHGQLNLGGTGNMTASGVSIQSVLESPGGGGTPKRKVPKKGGARSILEDDQPTECCTLLQKKYNHYTTFIDSIKSVIEDWDRQKGVLRPKKPLEIEEPTTKITPSRKVKGGKLKEEHIEICPEIPEPEESREGLGVSLLEIQANQEMEAVTRRLFDLGLPSTESILDGLGLSTDGVPIPGPVDFQVYPLPLKRKNIRHVPQERFCFIASSPDDPNAPKEEAPKSPPEPIEEPPSEPSERDHSSRVSKRTASVRSAENSDSTGHKKSPQKTSRKKSTVKIASPSPSPSQFVSAREETPPVAKTETPETKPTGGPVKLVRFRWVVPPSGETKLKLLFQSQADIGQFDQTLNFEITGTRRRTQLFCRGHCEMPTICQEPRSVFPSRKRTKTREEIVHKKFVLSENTYYFGPLHCGKTRDRYKDCRYPENMEVMQIKNISLSTVDAEFYFMKDQNANTFLLDPPNMTLKSGESETLRIWAYPKSADEIKDALVCCIKHNPNPVVFKLVCNGVEPDLKIDRKLIEFKKVLLHRKQTNVIYLHNHTMLPVAWKLSGLESLGEEFSFSQVEGVVQPRSDFPLSVNFRAAKQVNHAKKAFKIEISDVEKIMGLMHVENIQIFAEAYDVALDISFPKGTDGGLDFQCIRACDEQKLMIFLKNKGKYDIAYNFLFDVSDTGVDYTKIFSFSPTHNTLYPGEKAQPVSVVFKSNKEVTIVNMPILKCQVIDAHVGDQGEVIANIPIRVSAKAVFSHPLVSPASDINFGPMTINARKSASFTLENKGEFEFKYAITKKMSSEEQKIRAISMAAVAAKNRTKSRDGRESSTARMSFTKPSGIKNKLSEGGPLRTEVIGGSQRLVLGMFTVNSAMGSILAGQSQIITVDCIADDKSGPREEILSIEVSDRQIDIPPLSYKICGEVLHPEINTVDVASIFEEHRVCRRLGVLGQHQFHGEGCIGVYGEEERRFVFKSVIVGQLAKARFKISNNNKIACDVLVSVKSPTVKQKGSSDPVFEVQPSSKIAIPSHSHIYAIVSFKPAAMQIYNTTFEVTPEGATKSKCLVFELQGDGNLPQVSITRPTLHNAKGDPILLFKRLLLRQSQTLTITLKNTGTIPANVLLENTGDKAFTVTSMEDEIATFEDSADSQDKESSRLCSVSLDVNESKDCLAVFNPCSINKYHGEVCVCIQDNQFEKPVIQLVGEGYEDDVCLENVRGEVANWGAEERVTDDTNASVESHLHFGSIAVGESRQIVFTLTNRSKSNTTVKFQWPTSLPCLTFAPSLGHIKPGSSKDITVTFKAQANSESLSAQIIAGKIWKISLSQPADWDDRMKSVRWVNIAQPQLLSVDSSGTSSVLKQSITGRVPTPAKKKVIETDTEPAHSVVDESHRDLELLISAVADFAKFVCPVKEIRFKDTLMYQSKVFSFPIKNNGVIPVTYKWVMVDGDLKSEDKGMPFSIEPSTGIIQPDTETNFTVKFAPLDVFNKQSTFRCNMPNLDGSLEPLTLSVHGRSLMPYCHFELEHTTDYFSRRSGDGRRSFESSGTVDPASTRVIEFTSCGVGVKNTKRFDIINPTSSGYEFQWTASSSLQFNNKFKCLTPKGYVEGGKKFEIAFEYTPSSLESVESVWVFSIPSICLSHSFLLAGHTDEPSVHLDRAYLTFKAMLIGSKMKDTVYLVSNEPTPYKFSFDEKSCHCDGHSGQLVVEPMIGTIQPNTKIPVTVSFTARHEQDYNFSLNCKIKHKPDPLVLNVKAKGYAINTALSYTSPGGTEISLPVGKSETRVINFGSVPVNERALGQISVFNNGEYNMEYKWVLSSKCKTKAGGDLVCLSPIEGTVVPQDRAKFEVTFSPPSKMVLKGCEIQLQIVNGPTLPISLRGMGVEPQVEFSFEEHDFGPHFLHRSDMPATRKTLNIINNDKKDISVHCLYKDQPHLSVQFMSCILAPKEEAQAIFEFRPRDTISYSESVVFEINGLSRKSVSIRGDGAQMKIELADPAHKEIKFGALRIGEKVKKELKLANHSPIPLLFRLSLLPSSSTPALLKDGVLCVSPTEEISVEGNGGQSTVSIAFNPTTRVPQFSEEVTLECLGISQPLFVVSGSCIGLEITLDTSYIPFGPVVQDSQSSRRILMINSGDIGARFSWENRFGPDFELTPLDGYISPGMQITFDLIFRPSKLSHDIRYDKIPCHIEGRAKPLHLTLTGVCIEKVPIKEVLPFTTNVRNKETRNLTIPNKTNSHWLLRPLIEGEQWSGPETLSVGSNQSRHYELTYHPLTMTTDSQKHYGSIFFPQPDGTGVLYNLQGTAEPPKVVGSLTQEIPCKTAHTELLTVENWLRRPQRFRVDVHIVRPEKLDRSVSLHGLDYIDVPALGKRDYKLHFYSFKECSILAKVTFRNELSGEYLYYHVSFKSTPPGIMGTIELSTPVRKSASHVFTITNPLPTPVTLTTNCNISDISMPTNFLVGAQSEGKCMFEYLPLKVGEFTGKLTLSNSDLGVYQYELHLRSTCPPPERPIHFTTSLGVSQQQAVRFVSYARGRTEYICKVDNSDFHVERSITVASAGSSGTEASVDVNFEPSHLGDTPANLTISSSSGGDYSIPLHGHCLAPKPQGPFNIKPGCNISIAFRNIFTQSTQFVFSVDNPAFSVKAGDILKARKTYNIMITYDAKQADSNVARTGKLTVTSQQSAKPEGRGKSGGISWVYYLKGLPPA